MFTLCQHGCRRFSDKKLPKTAVVAVIGLDEAGKSSVVAIMKGDLLEEVSPMTIFMPEDIVVGKCKVQLFDLGGHDSRRDIWPTYYPEIHGLVYVVDGCNRDRIAETKAIMESVIEHKYIKGKKMLILVNKQDQPGAMSTDEVAGAFGIHPDDPAYCIKACSAVGNEGSKPEPELNDGVKWLLSTFLEDAGTLLPRIETETEEWREVERVERKLKRERVRKNREERERKEEEAAAAAAGGSNDGDARAADELAAKQAAHEANISAAKASGRDGEDSNVSAASTPNNLYSNLEETASAPQAAPRPEAIAGGGAKLPQVPPQAAPRKQAELGSGAKKKTRRKKKQKPKKNQIVPADEEDLPHANNNNASEA